MPDDSKWVYEQNIASGAWKFSSQVDEMELREFAQAWEQSDPHGWKDLHIRGVGHGEIRVIVFEYRLKGTLDEFHRRKKAELLAAFGEKFIASDIAAPVWRLTPV